MRDEIQISPKQSKIVIGAVKYDLLFRERFAQRRKIDIRERIDDCVVLRNADLKQTKFLAVRMQAVCFCIHCHALSGINFAD